MGGYSDDLEKRLRSDAAAFATKRGAQLSTGPAGPGFQDRKNIYQCQTCLGLICTVDRDQGVTPFMIDCKATADCRGPMQSSFYMAHSLLTATFEWFRPSADELAELCANLTGPRVEERAAAYVDHVRRGGLVLRPIKREGM